MNPFIYVFGLILTLDALREMAGAASVLGLW
ncbi:KPN_01571 family protein [Cronobacter muytjensii]|nr:MULTISPECIES: KPN_01571 family protein [Cronobacter]MDI6456376.1 KPN_01571 family protein [Cronobacter muytjensii]MEB8638672.1 KPN_01571 family protein [Cronobacter muytjensii]